MSRRRRFEPLWLGIEQTFLLTGVVLVLFGLEGFGDFRNNAWLPARLIWQGYSPAEAPTNMLSQRLGTPLVGMWGPLAWLAFLPLGSLRYETASLVWTLLNSMMFWRLPELVVSRLSWPKQSAYGALLLLFPPLLVMFALGQVSLLITFVTLASLKALLGGSAILAGGLLTISLLKPQLLFFVLPLEGALALRRGCGRQFGLGLVLGSGLQAVGLLLLRPLWPVEYWTILRENPNWFHPNLLSWLTALLPTFWGGAVWGLCAAGAGWWLVARLQRTPRRALLWGLALTPTLSPYSWSWDMVLGLPLFLHTLDQLTVRAHRWLLVGFVGLCLVVVGQRIVTGEEKTFVWVPIALLALCAVGEHLAVEG